MRIEFTSPIDKTGYKIVPAKRPPRLPGQAEADWVLGASIRDWVEARIVGLGGGRKALRLSNYPMLFGTFANLKDDKELFEFITHYGPLTKKNEIPLLLDAAKRMKAALQSKSVPPWPIADLKASLSTDKATGTITTKFRPATLLDALWLQLGQALSGGALKQCDYCGDWFPVGGKGRRIVTRFCSQEHSTKFYSLERTRKKRKR